MKQLFMTILLAFTTVAVSATDNDTLTIRKPQRVRIISGDSIQKIKIEGREGDEMYRYENTIQLVDSNYVSNVNINKDRWDLSMGLGKSDEHGRFHNEVSSHFGLGLTHTKGAEGFSESSFGNSWEIFWTIAQWDRYTPTYKNWYSVGFGIDWRNFRLDGREYFNRATDGTISIEEHPLGYDPSFSRVKLFSLNIPLLWGHKVNHNFDFAIGPVINLNTYGSILTRYKDADGKGHKDTHKKIHQKPLTIDLMAVVRLMNFRIYGKYSLSDTFNRTYTPQSGNFSSFSLGVYL